MLEIDLDSPTPALAPPDGANGVLLIFRRRRVVLGTRLLLPENLPLSALETAAIAAHACSLSIASLAASQGTPPARRSAKDASPMLPFWSDGSMLDRLDDVISARNARPSQLSASVVVCTRYRPDELAGCLEAIVATAPSGVQTIVVDNGPDHKTLAVAQRFADVRYVVEPVPGLSRARNAGLRAAGSEVVAFVDDDVRPEPGWIRPLLQALESEDAVVACGLVLPQELRTEAQVVFECELGFGASGLRPRLYDAAFVRSWPRGVPVWEIGAGANMAVRRQRAIELGGFDERLGPGAAGGCGDDSEFFRRVLFTGGRIVYEPFSVVRHRHRSSWDALAAQTREYAHGHVAALFAQYATVRDGGDLLRALVDLPLQILGRAGKWPLRRLRAEPDRLLGPWTRGFFAGLGQIGLAFTRHEIPGSDRGTDVLWNSVSGRRPSVGPRRS